MSHRRRHLEDNEENHSRHGDSRKRSHSTVASPRDDGDRHQRSKRPTFPSYLDAPDLPPKIRLLCEILANTPSASVEASLNDAGVRVTAEDIEEVLKLSYASPGAGVKFFRWAGAQIHDQHSPYAWNLVVDLLGKNRLFDAMWDAVRTMRRRQILSLATFASMFSSYVAADRLDDLFMSFELMDKYGVPRDVAALNSLLSAICRLGKTAQARDFIARVKNSILPDGDSYAILLEGWESEDDARNALETFSEMIRLVGWDPANVPAYDSFLTTLARGTGGIGEAIRHLNVMREKGCLPGMKFFRAALEEYLRFRDGHGASMVWGLMAWKNGCRPDAAMYNNMIALQCCLNQIDAAYRFLDEMVMYGVFPDGETYNTMLKFLVKGRKLRDASIIFIEMVKNECLPTPDNCKSAFKVFLDMGDTEMATRVWKCMVKNEMYPLEENGNSLILKLRDIDMLPEACKLAEDMAERGIKVHSSTLSKLKTSLLKLGKGTLYDQILRKWKSH